MISLKNREIDLTNQRFTNLMTIEPVDRKKKSGVIWKCICDCGNEVFATTAKLRIGHVKSCGCYRANNIQPKYGKKHWAWKGHEKISGSIWLRIKSAAKKRNKEFSVSIEDCWKIYENQNKKCAISGVPIAFAVNSKDLKQGSNTASLDRIDSKKGYIKGNVQWVHVKINYMKQSMSEKDFIKWCKIIATNN